MSGTLLAVEDITVNKTQSLPLRSFQSSGEQSQGFSGDKNSKRLEDSHVSGDGFPGKVFPEESNI